MSTGKKLKALINKVWSNWNTREVPDGQPVALKSDPPNIYSEHHEYTEMKESLALVQDAYLAGGGYLNGHRLHCYSLREEPIKFANRRRMAHYPSVFRTAIDVYPNAIFSREPHREQKSLSVKDVDACFRSCHGDRNETMRFAAKTAMAYTVGFICVDRPAGEIHSQQDANDRPCYVSVINPLRVIDWDWDEAGDLEWVKILEHAPNSRGGPKEAKDPGVRLRIWTKTTCELHDIERKAAHVKCTPVNDEAAGFVNGVKNHDLGAVPVIPFWPDSSREPGSMYGATNAIQAAKVNDRLYNVLSELDSGTRDTIFSMLTYEMTDPQQPLKPVFGAGGVIKHEKGTAKPGWIAPPPEPIKLLMEIIDRYTRLIFNLFRLETEMGFKPASVSATQRIFINEEAARSMRMVARLGSKIEFKVLEIIYRFKGLETRISEIYDEEHKIVWNEMFDHHVLADSHVNRNMMRRQFKTGSVEYNVDLSLDIMREMNPNMSADKWEIAVKQQTAAGGWMGTWDDHMPDPDPLVSTPTTHNGIDDDRLDEGQNRIAEPPRFEEKKELAGVN